MYFQTFIMQLLKLSFKIYKSVDYTLKIAIKNSLILN